MPTKINQIRKDFKKYTDKIKKAPHNPENWISRATWYLEGYKDDEKNQWPSLAAADAFKVFEWFSDPKFRRDNDLYRIPDRELREMRVNACRILVKALLQINDIREARKYYDQQNVPLTDDDKAKINSPPESFEPTIVWRRYQWIPSHFMHRDNFLHNIREDLKSYGMDLRPSRIGPPSPTNLGVFARKRFEKGEILFRENVFRMSSPSWNAGEIINFYAVAIEDVKKGAPRHLLSYSNIGPLTASYTGCKDAFQFKYRIVRYLQYFKNKDPTLLWNLDFDVWVLHTVQRRFDVNAFGFPQEREDGGEDVWSVISPIASLFQHSCEPNADWRNENDGIDVMLVKAAKVIQEGEEIYDSYGGLTMNLDDRRKKLMKWIGGDCECTRCVREEKEQSEEDAREADSDVEVASSGTSGFEAGFDSSSNEVDSDGDTRMGETPFVS
ncbi:hypothetical protein EG328_004851 [Venturia inaequalis]|uniref:SET domain-containing protein n=1 Tax=Venturia inaequalis TaxID=5025 RepID=A0A8H3UMA3_VENIN|nr:hypothetical protein EG328_004851 [Venturia inaequalis]